MHRQRSTVATLIALCACGGTTTTPGQPVAQPPPAAGAPAPPPAVGTVPPTAEPGRTTFPPFPAIPAAPASHPTGDPVGVPSSPARVGDSVHRTMTSSFEQHYTASNVTRYQKTDTRFELDIKTLEIAGDHPSKIEVTANVATEGTVLGTSPDDARQQDTQLLRGVYVVTAGKDGAERDGAHVARPGGGDVVGREQEELTSLFAATLRTGDPIERYLRTRKLRLGEAIVLDDAGKRALGGDDPLPGTFTLSLTRADTLVSYQIDVDSASGDVGQGALELRVQGTFTFDRTTGLVVEQHVQNHKIERYRDTVNDTFDRRTITSTRRR